MKAQVISFRRGRHRIKPRHFILQVSGVESKDKAEELVNKKVTWKSSACKEISGIVMAAHGNKGLVRAVFEKGLPGQAINTEVEVA